MKQTKMCALSTLLLLVIFARTGAAQSPVISKSTCEVGNLTIKERDPHDGRLVFVFSQTPPVGLPKTSFRTVDQVNGYFGSAATTELEAIDAICAPTRSLTEIVTFLQDTSGSSGTFTATPQAGGSITLADGTTLTIPAGAVAQNTDITVETQGILNPLDQGGVALIRLSPEGLVLMQSAALTVPVVVAPNFDLTQVRSIVFSTENPVLQDIDEFSIGEGFNNTPVAGATNTLTLSLNHFSLISLLVFPDVEIIPHLPPRFLQQGDLVFKLSGNANTVLYLPNWLPGHVAVYIASTDPSDLNQATVVEATDRPQIANTCPPLLNRLYGRGVFEDSITKSFINRGIIYMGARRPLLTTLTPTTRSSIANFAEGIAHSQTEQCYFPVGFPRPDPGSNFWSCTKFAVSSYLSAGVTEFQPFLSNPAIPPYTLFRKTAPVKDLTVGVGETLQIPVSVVAKPLPFVPPIGFYEENPSGSTLSLASSPIATLDLTNPASPVLALAPTSAQSCTVNTLLLSATGPTLGSAAISLDVTVHDFTFSQERPAGNITLRQPEIGVHIASACNDPLVAGSLKLDGAVVASISNPNNNTFADLVFVPATQLSLGQHTVSVDVIDQSGARKSDSFSFNVTSEMLSNWQEVLNQSFSYPGCGNAGCFQTRVFNVLISGTPYDLEFDLSRQVIFNNVLLQIELCQSGQTLVTGGGCFIQPITLVQSAFGSPVFTPTEDVSRILGDFIAPFWNRDLPGGVEVSFPLNGVNLSMGCTFP